MLDGEGERLNLEEARIPQQAIEINAQRMGRQLGI